MFSLPFVFARMGGMGGHGARKKRTTRLTDCLWRGTMGEGVVVVVRTLRLPNAVLALRCLTTVAPIQ